MYDGHRNPFRIDVNVKTVEVVKIHAKSLKLVDLRLLNEQDRRLYLRSFSNHALVGDSCWLNFLS